MTCQRIPFGNGYAIVCGPRRRMSQKERLMTAEKRLIEAERKRLIERTRMASQHHADMAKLCYDAGQEILGRWHDAVAKEAIEQIRLQQRALSDDALGAVEKV